MIYSGQCVYVYAALHVQITGMNFRMLSNVYRTSRKKNVI